MKKIVIIYKFLPQYRVDFYQQLRKKLCALDIEFELIYGKHNDINALKKDEVDIDWALYVPNRTFKIGRIELLWQPCLKHLKDTDLVIAQQENKLLLNYYLTFMRNFRKQKFAYWAHVSYRQNSPKSLGNRYRKLFVNRCDWWFGYTKSAKEELIANKYPQNKITIVQNAIDTTILSRYYSEVTEKEIKQVKSSLGIQGENIAIYCGGLYPQKDFGFIIQTCKLVRQKIPDFHMIFIGSGIEESKIISECESNNWIHYMGPKFGNERVVYFKISAVQLMPKSVGLCILDSFALETPIMTTNHPSHGPEIDYLSNEVNGIMTQDDINIYSDKVAETLLTRRYVELIEDCRISAKLYTVENMTANFANGILECLNLKNRH